MSNDILEDIGLKIQELVMAEFENALTSDWFSRTVRDEVEAVYEDGHCRCCDLGYVRSEGKINKTLEHYQGITEKVAELWRQSTLRPNRHAEELVTGLEKRVTELEGEQ